MKKYLQLICAGFVALLLFAGIALFPVFPVDAQPYVEKKYSGWNGVLQAWVCTNWNPDGGFIRWLNSSAFQFEKAHNGIYLEFTPVQEDTLRNVNLSGLRMPDLIFFSPGVITNHGMLNELHIQAAIRSDLKDYGGGKAIPVALGGYMWAYNTSLLEYAPHTTAEFITPTLPKDVPAAVLIGLLSGSSEKSSQDIVLPDSGIDLGLPAFTGSNVLYSADAIDRFIEGELACVPVDAKTLARLERLREKGAGTAWDTAASGELSCTDQILLAGIPFQEDSHDRSMLAEEFISSLLAKDAQSALADIGAFSVTGERIYSDFSVYSKMDAMLHHLPLWVPGCFSEYSFSNQEDIVRGFLRGEISAKNALSLLGFEEV